MGGRVASFGGGKNRESERGGISGMENMRIGTVGTGKGAVPVQLGFGKDKPVFYPVTAVKGHDEHHAVHAREMSLSLQEWKREAANLLNAKASENFMDWHFPVIGKFIRYDRNTNRIAIGDRNGNIRTFFILKKSARSKYLPREYLAILNTKK